MTRKSAGVAQPMVDLASALLPELSSQANFLVSSPLTQAWPQFSLRRLAAALVLRALERILAPPSSSSHPSPTDLWLDSLWSELSGSRKANLRTVLTETVDSYPAKAWTMPTELLVTLLAPEERHALGAFYTPAPVADMLLDQLPLAHRPRAALLDPSCGTGVFLARAALRRLESRHRWSTQQAAAALQGIIGVDIDPLAVLATKVTLLLTLRPFLDDKAPVPAPSVLIGDVLAPHFSVGPVEHIVGNPPWIRWSKLPPSQRQASVDWLQRLGIRPPAAFHGGSELDVAALLACIHLHRDLVPGGMAALLLPDSVMRSSAAGSFRRCSISHDIPATIVHANEFVGNKLFAGASFRAVGITWKKQSPRPRTPTATRVVVRQSSLVEMEATLLPGLLLEIGPDHRWIWTSAQAAGRVQQLEGTTTWLRGRKGVTTDLNGAYFVRILGVGSQKGTLRVVNDVATRGHKVPVHDFDVEAELVYPLIKGGGQVRAFQVVDNGWGILLPNRKVTGLSEEAFSRKFPLAYEHFLWVERHTHGGLRRRSTFRRMLQARGAPFYAVYNVGSYTFAPIKVVWAEVSRRLEAATLTMEGARGWWDGPRVPVVDHKLYFATVDSLDQADFLTAWLNSSQVRDFVQSLFQRLQVGSLFRHVWVPPFEPAHPLHLRLAALGAKGRGEGEPPGLQSAIDETVERLIGERKTPGSGAMKLGRGGIRP